MIRDTNFLEELYTDDELNAENIKDREAKMKFLQKLIDVTSKLTQSVSQLTIKYSFNAFIVDLELVTEKELPVKSSKIVAGLEADRTNELFQAIAFALENKLDSKDAVSSVLHGQRNGVEPKNPKAAKIETKLAKPTKAQPPSRDRTPAKPEPKKAITSQRSIDKKPTATKEKVAKEKERSTSKSRAPTDPKETRKLKKAPSREKEVAPKTNGEVVTNGSIDSHSSIQSLPRQASIEKKEEQQPLSLEPNQIEQKPHANDDSNKENEMKVNGDTNHHDSEPEREAPQEPQRPQDELAAIIDEEAEYRRKEKVSKKLSAKHRQKTLVEDGQQATVEANEANAKTNQSEKIERFQSSYKRESFDRPRTSLRPPSARPASSRPAAPRRRDKNVEIVLQPDETMKLGDISVKMENFTKELEDDGENLVIIEDSAVVSDSFMNERLARNSSEETNEDEQGKLVQQILETEKNFEGALGMEAKKTEIVRRIYESHMSRVLINCSFLSPTGIRRVEASHEH